MRFSISVDIKRGLQWSVTDPVGRCPTIVGELVNGSPPKQGNNSTGVDSFRQ